MARRSFAGAVPTDEQISEALYSLAAAGYSSEWMDASFRDLGAKMAQRTGTVTAWLSKMTPPQIDRLIDQLQPDDEPEPAEAGDEANDEPTAMPGLA